MAVPWWVIHTKNIMKKPAFCMLPRVMKVSTVREAAALRWGYPILQERCAPFPWFTHPWGSNTTFFLQDLHFLMFETLLEPLLTGRLVWKMASGASPFFSFLYHLSYSTRYFLIVSLCHFQWLFWFLFPFQLAWEIRTQIIPPSHYFLFWRGRWKGLKLSGEAGKRYLKKETTKKFKLLKWNWLDTWNHLFPLSCMLLKAV